jgi:hypothetical protein
MAVTAVSGWPSSFPYTLLVDKDTVNEEIVTVTARTGTTLTVTRGADGTSGVAHGAGANVQHGVSARDFDEPNAFVNGTGVVSTALIADSAVTSVKIADGTIVNADVNASAAIAQSKIATLVTDLAAKADYSLPVNAQTGTTYTFVIADGTRLTTASNAAASTYTIPPQSSVVWVANSVIRIVNYGAGTVTIAGGAGVTVTNATKTLAQFESAALIRTAENAWTLVPFSGAGDANFSDAATGTYTDSGVDYKYITFTGSGTLTVTKAGLCDVLVVGGGGGGGGAGDSSARGGGGAGAGGFLYLTNVFLSATSHSITVGAGGAGGANLSSTTTRGSETSLGSFIAAGGGYGSPQDLDAGIGGSGGGNGDPSGATRRAGSGISGMGNNGGLATGNAIGGGGGGGSGSVGGNTTTTAGGTAGSGTANSITNSSITRSAGGAGGSASGAVAGANGSANSGNGGGGASGTSGGSPFAGGNGGSGVVIIRVRT